jgi:branched-chain amino acid:cation transporter, LIVCS family
MKISYSHVALTSLTIFAMLFGAGNLMFPLRLGLEAGSQSMWALAGFIMTGVILPLLGLLSIVAFQGNYQEFFGRLGRIPAQILILYCMMVLGPLVVMPRIVTLSYEMLRPFLPDMSAGMFALFFLSLVFAATCRPGKLLTIIGKVLSPFKIASLIAIVAIGLVRGVQVTLNTEPISTLFFNGVEYGYYTLDLLGAIFFGSIIVSLLTNYASAQEKMSTRQAVKIAGVSSVFAALLLGFVYAGMTALGAYHGFGLEMLNEGEIFSAISFRILGAYGAALIALTVFLACFTTTVSLSAVVTDYVRTELTDNKLPYPAALALVLALTAFIARHGLGAILTYSVPFIVASYPVFICITLCNLAYSLFGIRMIRTPTLLVFLAVVAKFVYQHNFFIS